MWADWWRPRHVNTFPNFFLLLLYTTDISIHAISVRIHGHPSSNFYCYNLGDYHICTTRYMPANMLKYATQVKFKQTTKPPNHHVWPFAPHPPLEYPASAPIYIVIVDCTDVHYVVHYKITEHIVDCNQGQHCTGEHYSRYLDRKLATASFGHCNSRLGVQIPQTK